MMTFFGRAHLKWGAIILAISLIGGCATTTGPDVSSQEISRLATNLKEKARVYRAAQKSRIEAIGNRLISYMPAEDRSQLQGVQYEISDQAGANAYATLTKKVGVTYGMLRFCESDDELALVVAHELAHISKGSVNKHLGTSILATAAGLAAGVAVESVATGTGTAVAQSVSRGINGGFSRDYEREADFYAVQYAYVAGFDPVAGGGLWERMAIELPASMTADFFSTHPSSPERLIRTQKTIQDLLERGIQPNLFNRAAASPFPGNSSNPILKGSLGLTQQVLAVPAHALSSTTALPIGTISSFASSSSSSASPSPARLKEAQAVDASKTEPGEDPQAAEDREKHLVQLQEEQKKRSQATPETLAQQAREKVELEKALLEAKEAAKQLRYSEFGVQAMGLARKATNLWLGQKISGKQNVFPLSQKSVDWYITYKPYGKGSLDLNRRQYRAYWYTPDGRLYSEQDFLRSSVRYDFAKTTLEWDLALGDYLIGRWLVRIFQEGEFLDEHTFEIVKS